MVVVLHYLTESRARRIFWLLEELGIPYELKEYKRNPKTRSAPPELSNLHPSKKSPVITDGDLTVAESGLICKYLVDKYGNDTDLYPRNEKDRLHIEYGLFASESNIMIGASQLMTASMAYKILPIGIRSVAYTLIDRISDRYAKPETYLCLHNLEDIIKENQGFFSGGRLTAADIMYETVIYLLKGFDSIPDFDEKFPVLEEWHQRLLERPALKKVASHEEPQVLFK